jgi:hypothetical protein
MKNVVKIIWYAVSKHTTTKPSSILCNQKVTEI